MSAVAGATSGHVDLEKELSCSICTDVLYQPLTLLDCLHTFCGSCLKEWFRWQATAAAEHRTPHPYTCPSCRAPVRSARPNANVTTLLDMFLQVNPSRGKSEQEKEEMRKSYKPGDDVLPTVEYLGNSDSEDGEDERLLEHVRELSVADLDPAVEANRRAQPAARERRAREGNTARDVEIRRRENAESARRRQDAVERNVSHQPSLRSLLSASGEDSAEVQQEILASILSSGMLDNVDIDNLTPEQEEELTERIADAYRRRHRELRRTREQNQGASTSDRDQSQHTARSRERTATDQATSTRSRPPVSRPHLIEQWTQDSARAGRRAGSSSSHNRRESSSNTRAGASIAHTALTTTPPRTANDSADRNTGRLDSTSSRHQLSADHRSNTDPLRPGSSSNSGGQAAQRRTTDSHNAQRRSTDSHRDVRWPVVDQPRSTSNPLTTPSTTNETIHSPPYPTEANVPRISTVATHLPPQQRPEDSQFAPQFAIAIPHVTCNRCNRPDIQHQVHYHCDKCSNGDFDICLRCYRSGAGCNNWWGFGYSAQVRFERNAPEGGWPASYERPHILAPRRYQRHSEYDTRTQDLSTWKALQEGVFCERCLKNANDRYWHCVVCMEGAWGFCAACVNRGKHCTHPLLPTAWRAGQPTSSSTTVSLPHVKAESMVIVPPTRNCAICHQDIPRIDSYLHCPSCNDGEYDMCTSCHRSLLATGKISGSAESRRCLQGHSMELIQFQEQSGAIEQRVVLADSLPQSTALHTNDARCLALWSWFPAEGIDDELAFPKYAELRYVKAVNEDYSIGTYAGDVGLFPSNHVRTL